MSEFSFISPDLLAPGNRRRQTGISVTSCHRRDSTAAGSPPHRRPTDLCGGEGARGGLAILDIWSVLIVRVFLCSPPCSYLWVADLYFSALIIFVSFLCLSLSVSLSLSFFLLLSPLVIEVSFFNALSCRVLVMQILTCSFGLLAIN